jgi:hypothetical protein
LVVALAMLANVACGTNPVRSPGGTTGGTIGAGGTAGAKGGTTGGAGGMTSGAGGTAGSTGASGGAIGAGGTGGSAGTIGAGGTGGGAGGQAGSVGPATLCSAWTSDLATQNQRALEQQGFFQSLAILEGTLGERFDQQSQSYARFTVGKVRAGVSAYAGREIAIAMAPGLHATFGAGASVLVGLSSTYSFTDTSAPTPLPPATWGNLLTVVKKEDEANLPADLLGFRAWHAPNVAVVRVRELQSGRIAFDVVETLAGSLPGTFLANWSDTWGPLPVAVGDERIGGFGEIVTIMGATLTTQVVELRPNTADERARALRGIAAVAPGGFAAAYRDELDRARTEATRYRLAWTFGRAERVLAVELAGLASECCTNAGGTFFANTVSEVLRGDAPAGPVVTGGHGVRSDDACGDRFLLAMRSLATASTGSLTDYTCSSPAPQITTSTPTSVIEVKLPATPANRDDVGLWLRSATPLLRLYAADAAAPAGAFTPPAAPAPLSVPVPALTAIQARHQLILLTIVDVQSQPGGGAAVRVRTPFYYLDLAHLTNVEATLFVPCADPRLLQVGRRWVGALVGSGSFSGTTAEASTYLAEQRLMLVPGFLIPAEREDLVRTAEALTKVTIPAPFGH